MTDSIQAAGGAATIALGTGVIADISSPHERGKFVGVFQFTGTFATASTFCLCGGSPGAHCSQLGLCSVESLRERLVGDLSSGS